MQPVPASESLCRRCGRCCAKKVILDGRVIYTPFYCEHLDPETRLCRVYEQRHEVNVRCLPVAQAVERGVLPADCPYVAGREPYTPPIEAPAGELADEVLRLAAEKFDLSAEEVAAARASLEVGMEEKT